MPRHLVVCVLLGWSGMVWASDWSIALGVGVAEVDHNIKAEDYDPNVQFIYELEPRLGVEKGVRRLIVSRELTDRWTLEGAVQQMANVRVLVVNDRHKESRRVFEMDAYGAQLGVRRSWILRRNLDLSVSAGAFFWEQKVRTDPTDPLIRLGEFTDEVLAAAEALPENGVDGTAGLGLDFHLNERLTFRGETMYYQMSSQNQTVVALSFQIKL